MITLLAALEAHFDDAEGGIRIVNAEWCEDDLELMLSITYHDDREAELWSISCHDVVEESLCSEWATGLEVSAHSPLLKPFLEAEVPLMFSRNEMVPEALFGIVCSCCIEVVGRMECLARFINGKTVAHGICGSPYGLLGRFPASVASHILDALQDKPIQVNALAGLMPKRWNGTEHVPYSHLQALEIGQSYVIAERFNARRR